MSDFLQEYKRGGYCVVRGLFSALEVAKLRQHLMHLRLSGPHEGDLPAYDPASEDPLQRFPRMINMHRWDKVSLRWLLDARLAEVLTALLGVPPLAVQTMIYFKPPGARGQALHQDQYYLRTRPGTCMAAWLALDDSDEGNGCMQVVPGTQNLPLLCTQAADLNSSFTGVTVPTPASMQSKPVIMKAGDVLFFNGSIIHGSYPNTSRNRFRQALIGHYIQSDAKEVADYFHPVLRMDGTVVNLGVSKRGGACGKWVDGKNLQMVEELDNEALEHE